MKIEHKDLPRGQAELQVELSVEEYQPFAVAAAQKISEQTTIPGFRTGKAPYDMVVSRVGEQKIWEEALEPAIKKTLLKAIADKQLQTIGSPTVDVVTLAAGNPVVYKATVNLLPNVTLADLKTISVKRTAVNVDDAKMEKTIQQLRDRSAKEALVNRPSQTGDKVELNVDTFLDNIPVDQGQHKKLPIILGSNTFIPGFEEQIIGLKTGDVKEFQLTFPKNYHHKQVAGKPVDFKVNVEAVFERTVPELTDELAKNFGEFNSVAELKDHIKKSILEEEQTKEQQRLEEAAVEQLITKSTFGDVPDLLVSAETKKMIEELQRNIVMQGLKYDEYLQHLKKSNEELMLDFTPQAVKRIKGALALRALAKQNDLQPTPSQINEEIQTILKDYGDNPEAQKHAEEKEFRDYVANILTSRMVMEYLVKEVVTE